MCESKMHQGIPGRNQSSIWKGASFMKLTTAKDLCQIASHDKTLSILDFQCLLKLMAYADQPSYNELPKLPVVKRGRGRPRKTENQKQMIETAKNGNGSF